MTLPLTRREFVKTAGGAGAMSCLTGIAARKSIDERRSVRISDLVRL
jgi:hypothetical protein